VTLKKTNRRQSRTVSSRGMRLSPPAGVVGMGLMGTSIAACLLSSGHSVVCVGRDPAHLRDAKKRLLQLLRDGADKALIRADAEKLMSHVTICREFSALSEAEIVVESTVEDLAVKRQVIASIEKAVGKNTLIGSNTSALPVTELQRNAAHPERILGLHWAEPAHITRFMEVICGKQTSPANARRAMRLARQWGKEPSLLHKDIRGFITNRIMYAMLREAFYLVENGFASVADVDRSLRNDYGYWITFAGPFRFMDLTGIPAYQAVMKDLLPDLSCATEVPELMRKVVNSGARGVANAKGFYHYTPRQAKRWEELFIAFSHEIRELAGRYPEDSGDKPSAKRSLKR
jgi:3-hydroxyacyl-CoA dehydrogenase